MDTVYLVYVVDEEEDVCILDNIFKSKERAEEYMKHYNVVTKTFVKPGKLKVREMKLYDA